MGNHFGPVSSIKQVCRSNRAYSIFILAIVSGCAHPEVRTQSDFAAVRPVVNATESNTGKEIASLPKTDSPPISLISHTVGREDNAGSTDELPELGELQPVSAELTRQHLEELAMTHHPAITRAHANIAALRGKWLQAGLPPNPVAQYNSDEIGNDGASGLHRMAISQTIVTANKLCLGQHVVAAEIDQAQADLAVARLRVQTDVRSAFLTALVAQQRLELVGQLRRIAEKSLQSVQAMGSETSRIELLQAQTALQQAILATETAQATLDGARQRLTSVVAMESLPAAPLVGTVDAELDGLVYDRLQQEMITSSPELAGRAAAIDVARRSYQLACASITPNVTTQFGVGVDTATDDTFGSLQVSVPLPLVNRNQGNLRRWRGEIHQADRALEHAQLNLSWRLATAFQSYEVAKRRRERIRTEILPRAEETLKLTNQAFEVGEASFLQMLTVQRTLFESQLTLLDATAEAANAANLINGFLLSGSMTRL